MKALQDCCSQLFSNIKYTAKTTSVLQGTGFLYQLKILCYD